MEYTIENFINDEKTIEKRAAEIAGLKFVSCHNGGVTFLYSDYGLNSIQNIYKKTLKKLIQDFKEDGIYSSYKYNNEYIESVEKYIRSIKPNSRKVKPIDK